MHSLWAIRRFRHFALRSFLRSDHSRFSRATRWLQITHKGHSKVSQKHFENIQGTFRELDYKFTPSLQLFGYQLRPKKPPGPPQDAPKRAPEASNWPQNDSQGLRDSTKLCVSWLEIDYKSKPKGHRAPSLKSLILNSPPMFFADFPCPLGSTLKRKTCSMDTRAPRFSNLNSRSHAIDHKFAPGLQNPTSLLGQVV